MRAVRIVVYLYLLILVAGLIGSTWGQSGIDSGGNKAGHGGYKNHSSIGSPFATVPGTAGDHGIYLGLIEVLYPSFPPNPKADSDGNGLPDQWERDNFGDIGVDPDDDADKDGATNYMEFLAKTDPNDPLSVFRPAAYSDGSELVLPVATQTGRAYRIWGSADLAGWSLLDSLSGDGSVVEWSYPLSDPAQLPYFVRIEIILP